MNQLLKQDAICEKAGHMRFQWVGLEADWGNRVMGNRKKGLHFHESIIQQSFSKLIPLFLLWKRFIYASMEIYYAPSDFIFSTTWINITVLTLEFVMSFFS